MLRYNESLQVKMDRKKTIPLLLFFLALPGIQAGAQSEKSAPALIREVRKSIAAIKPFKVNFVQQVFDEDQLEIEETGEILFKDHNTLKWTYLNPDYKVFLLEGENYKFYDRENEQLTIGTIKDKNRQWLWQLLFSQEISPYIKTDEKNKKIYIKNEPESLDVEILVNSDFLPVKAIQQDPTGVRMVYYFKEYRKKIHPGADAFTLAVPPGVEVISE